MTERKDSALQSALEIQKAAAAVGFDWPDARGPRAKIAEELVELDPVVGNAEKMREELGDLLFAIVNYARHLGIEPERALGEANEKFRRRFGYIEKRLAAQGLRPQELDLEALDALWDEVKRGER